MSRVLLTGASGFIGRHALPALLEAGHEVHAVARRRLADSPDGVLWHEADLLADGARVVAEVRPQTLVHLAWYAEHGKFWSSPENRRWVTASLSLLRAFADAGGSRAVVAGTCAEYEWSREVYPENAPLAPSTLYGAAKRGLHEIAAGLADQRGFQLAWGRVFFLYGPFEAPARLVPSLIVSLLSGQPAQMTAGTQRRDFLHVADAGAAFAALAGSDVAGAVNVASGQAVELRELGREIATRLHGEELLVLGARPMPEGDPPSLVADVTRLTDEVGWRPRIELADGLDTTIEWWRQRLDVAKPRP